MTPPTQVVRGQGVTSTADLSILRSYAALPRTHREEVSRVATIGPADLNKAAVFEQFAPQPFD